MLLYHLQRHSDHHANPTRRYQTLRDFEESPVLPTGYAGMIVLALVPADLAPGDGPARARALRRRPDPGEHPPRKRDKILAKHPADRAGEDPAADSKAADDAAAAVADEVLAARCPGCGYIYEVDAGDEHEGFAAGTAWSDIPDDWCCPDCGVREKVDFVAFDPTQDAKVAS